jgi:hypothetical protein
MNVAEGLHYHKVCARQMPKMLTDEQKMQHKTSALMFLQRYNIEGEKFLYHIVTGDKTWISYSNNEMKKQSLVLKHSGQPKLKKVKLVMVES